MTLHRGRQSCRGLEESGCREWVLKVGGWVTYLISGFRGWVMFLEVRGWDVFLVQGQFVFLDWVMFLGLGVRVPQKRGGGSGHGAVELLSP